MDRDQERSKLAEWLEAQIWEGSDREIQLLSKRLAARLAGTGLSARDVLGELSDEGLVVSVQRGFLLGEAFEVLLEERYRVSVFRWCRRWRMAEPDAEDLWSELLVKFLRTRFGSYRPRESRDNFRAWLWTAAHHHWVQELRRKRAGPLDERFQPSTNGHSALELAAGAELERRLEAALAELPADQAHVLRETMDGRSAGELAEELGRSRQAVFMLLFRARRHLERALHLTPPEPAS
jgi:RNA polymerase sigma factor (sigma-70 family)